MKKFSAYQYIKISIANCFGLDKLSWEDRIAWVDEHDTHMGSLEALVGEADDPHQYLKAIRAMHDAENGIPTGYIMSLDATASGLQVMACMTGCKTTARNTNLISTGTRVNFYQKVTDTMNKNSGKTFDVVLVKRPVMTTFYGSKAQPKKVFGDGTPELEAFYETLEQECPGPMEMMVDTLECWDSTALRHKWTLPDGHTAYVPVTKKVKQQIKVAELDFDTFTYQTEINAPSTYSVPLIANIVHSVDAWVAREMVRKASQQGFDLLTIHDAFFASPNHMQKVRQNYVEVLAKLANMDLLGHIFSELLGEVVSYKKLSKDLGKEILASEYALS